jgi:anaerobic magnesium-protoporphyrin IX monomethyl ester cyclase
MKVHLVYVASEESFGNFAKLAKNYSLLPPLGIIQLASFVEQDGHDVRAFDTQSYEGNTDDLLQEILEDSPDVVGFSAITPYFDAARRMAGEIKHRSGAVTIIGGVHFSLVDNSEFHPEFDYGIRGEGEIPFRDLLASLETGRLARNIPGLTYREGDGGVVTNPRAFGLDNLDNIPKPDWGLLPMHKYRIALPNGKRTRTVSVMTARGCPFKCAFCAEPRLFGNNYKVHSAKRIVDEMEETVTKYDVRHFFFFDSTLTLRRQLIVDMCREIVSRKLDITFEGYTRVNVVDKELFTLMKKAGLVRISLGIESANKDILKLIRKDIDLDLVRRAFRIMRDLRIEALSFAMIGNPGETLATIKETVHFIRSVSDITFSNLSIAVPYPGTELHAMATSGEHGLRLLSRDYTQYNRYEGGVLEVNGLTPARLSQLQKKYLIYMNATPRRVLHLVRRFGFKDLLPAFLKNVRDILFSPRTPKSPSI